MITKLFLYIYERNHFCLITLFCIFYIQICYSITNAHNDVIWIARNWNIWILNISRYFIVSKIKLFSSLHIRCLHCKIFFMQILSNGMSNIFIFYETFFIYLAEITFVKWCCILLCSNILQFYKCFCLM